MFKMEKFYRHKTEIKNLPKSFVESCKVRHKDGCCGLCLDIQSYSRIRYDDIFDGIPWIRENDIPPCIWSIGLIAFVKHDAKYQARVQVYEGRL